ncbi:MAG: PaaI family thioesterase [Bacillati bacterium ANGP1]|uniref:Acyl-coenzyme A thioesterase THEM4 n=1 Tax=Candidatus Segetimicrobium genomatis TaxID=2569760 RepID=A0A537JJ46_9BACT|nr:MAG: PaaI family thioesterase [Terrabacteria group bacterium ANGP1]
MREGSGCFACGQDNPIGLRLRFTTEGDAVRAEFTPGPQYQGYDGVLHGGIVAAALDDAMANLFHLRGRETLTARLEIRFRREAPVGQRLVVTARLTGERRKLFTAEAALTLPDGTPLAEAKGTFIRGV